jgi:transcription regulator MmyB-like protein
VRSERFRKLWARHDVKPKRSGRSRIDHPQVGELDLGYEKLPIADADRLTLVLYHATPGSRSAQALGLLASTIAGAAASTPTDGALTARPDRRHPPAPAPRRR